MNSLTRIFSIVLLAGTITTNAQMALENSPNETKSTTLVEDLTAPRTDLLRTMADAFVFGPATRIKFKIIEEESGVASTYFKIADFPYMKSDGRQMMPHDLADGEYQMRYYSTDNEGNQEQIRTQSIIVDKKGPKIRSGFSSSPTSFEQGIPLFPGDIQLAVDVADERVDVQKVHVIINEDVDLEFENSEHIDLTEYLSDLGGEKVYIEIRAYDTFYNLSKEIVEFKLAD